MSRLSVYWPDECHVATAKGMTASMILPFPKRIAEEPRERMDVVTRARLIFGNRRCPHCTCPMVEPVELDDALVNLSGLEIPGTATLVGFRCQSCDTEWCV